MAVGDPQPDLQATANNPGPAPAGGTFDGSVGQPKPEEVRLAPDRWTDDLALRIVVNDFERAQQHRSQNFDSRWDDHDRLLHANVVQRVWDGTNTPRSSLGVRLVWQQVEALLPAVMDAIFQSSDGIFFDCFPRPGTNANQANSTRELIASQYDDINIWETVRKAAKCCIFHGTGIVKDTWMRTERKREFWSDEIVPFLGKIGLSTKRQFKRRTIREQINRPDINYTSIRDFYVDPGHKLPQVPGAQFAIHRATSSMDELLLMGQNDPSYKIPSKEDLIEIVRQRGGPSSADADTHKQLAAQEADIFESYPRKGSIDPAKAKYELLEYWTLDRLITVMNRKYVIRNIANPYLRIPFISFNYTDVLDQFYGKGIADIIGDEQRLQQGLINAHVDEVSLVIHRAIVVQSGSVLNKQQLRTQPGQVIEATNADAVKELDRKPVTQDWSLSLQQSQIRAQQYTGVTDIITSGAPQVQTSLTRTATGTSALSSAAHGRIQYLVENIEQNLIVPLLDHTVEMNQRFLDPRKAILVLGKTNAQLISINPVDVTNGQFRFELRAASRMVARNNMQQSLPWIMQNLMNPAYQAQLMQQGMKIDSIAVTRDMLEVLGWRNRSDWFVPITPQDEARMQQQQMGPQMALLQMKNEHDDQRMANKAQQNMANNAVGLAKLVIQSALKDAPMAASAALGRALEASGAGDSHDGVIDEDSIQ